MDSHIVFTCPVTGKRVDHLSERGNAARLNDHEIVVCPACAKVHFINLQTGKLLGHKN